MPTDLNALSRVLAWFDGFASDSISQRTWLQCKTALAEGFTNAVRHAHQGRPADLPIEIVVKIDSRSLTMQIFDEGPPFDLEAKLAGLPEQIDTGATGGRGLKLMQFIADRFSYTRTEGDRNCLELVKHFAE